MDRTDDIGLLFRGELLLDALALGTKRSWSSEDVELVGELVVLIRRIRFEKVRRWNQRKEQKRKRTAANRISSIKT